MVVEIDTMFDLIKNQVTVSYVYSYSLFWCISILIYDRSFVLLLRFTCLFGIGGYFLSCDLTRPFGNLNLKEGLSWDTTTGKP